MVKPQTTRKYKVVGYDSFSHEEFPVGHFNKKDDAVACANAKGGTMTLMYVYDTVSGHQIHKAGTF